MSNIFFNVHLSREHPLDLYSYTYVRVYIAQRNVYRLVNQAQYLDI